MCLPAAFTRHSRRPRSHRLAARPRPAGRRPEGPTEADRQPRRLQGGPVRWRIVARVGLPHGGARLHSLCGSYGARRQRTECDQRRAAISAPRSAGPAGSSPQAAGPPVRGKAPSVLEATPAIGVPMSRSVLVHSRYRPARGGHAPGDLRNAFLEAVEAFEVWEEGSPEPTVEVRDQPIRLSVLCGLLWNCSDIMPGLDQRQLEGVLPSRYIGEDRSGTCFTYARAARAMREAIVLNG